MGLFNSMCPECGGTVPNSDTYKCKQCGAQCCKTHLEPREYVKKGLINDKTVVHYHCVRCGKIYDEAPKR